MIQREALAAKDMDESLAEVFSAVLKSLTLSNPATQSSFVHKLM
jgi:hypothetical protein